MIRTSCNVNFELLMRHMTFTSHAGSNRPPSNGLASEGGHEQASDPTSPTTSIRYYGARSLLPFPPKMTRQFTADERRCSACGFDTRESFVSSQVVPRRH